MRWLLIALLLAGGAARAQPVPDAPATARPHRTLAERFDEANTTHDGRLTPEQARSKMPMVSRNFAAIDAGNRGYVTVADIKAYNREQRALRRAAKPAESQ